MNIPDLEELYNIEIEEYELYHVSSSLFDFPDKNFLVKETNWHNNGALGLWASTKPKTCKGFGKFTYKFKLNKNAKIVGWQIRDFYKFCNGEKGKGGIEERKEYIQIRDYLVNKGIDVIYILDMSRCINEVIVLNYNTIKHFCLTEGCEDFSVPIEVFDKIKQTIQN